MSALAAPRRSSSDTRRWRWAGRAFLVSLVVIYGFPVYWMLATSFKTPEELGSLTWIPSGISLEPYREFLRSDFLPALRNSAVIAALTGVITMVLAVPAAYGLARSRSRLVTPLLLLLLIVQMIPTSATFIPLFRLLASLGLIDTYLGVSLAQATLFVPFAVLLLRPAFAGIPVAVEEAATLDGAGSLRYLMGIALPLVRNTVIVTAAIVLVSSWAELVYPLTLLLDDDKYPLSVLIAQSIGRFENNYSSLMSIAVLSSLPVLLVVLAAQNQLRRGLTIGAVK
jgi:multiple sugar transport system permease protein